MTSVVFCLIIFTPLTSTSAHPKITTTLSMRTTSVNSAGADKYYAYRGNTTNPSTAEHLQKSHRLEKLYFAPSLFSNNVHYQRDDTCSILRHETSHTTVILTIHVRVIKGLSTQIPNRLDKDNHSLVSFRPVQPTRLSASRSPFSSAH